MCGIAGCFDPSRRQSSEMLEHSVSRMVQTLYHRGPNDSGMWTDTSAGIAIGMRRLAILDLSPAGKQPMHSESGRYVLAFNGEIYNCEDLRRQLLTQSPELRFRGHSDTEVMLGAFDQWGLVVSLQRFNGMFAFALWDRKEHTLTLARDRFGEKPLYYAIVRDQFLFGSELKAMRAHPEISTEIDTAALALYLERNCVPAPHTIYRGVKKLPPATWLTLRDGRLDGTPQSYWSLREAAERGTQNLFRGTEDEAIESLDALLRDAVKIRMHADVPLGAFLSGGIDSSTVVSLMQVQSGKPIKTFSLGLYEGDYNEASDAARVAKHLGTDHTEFYATSREALEVVPLLPEMYDEPFADSSQIPTFLIARLARQHATVSISGDGGDEIFGGYNRHTWGGALWQKIQPFPLRLRKLGAASLSALSPDAWDLAFRTFGPVLPRNWRQRVPGYKVHKLASVMASADAEEMYDRFATHWSTPGDLLQTSVAAAGEQFGNGNNARLPSPTERMMYRDAVTYLPDDILVKVDRATMAVSLEGRIPLLDHRVAEFAWHLPLSLKIRGREGKWILRQVLYRYVPRQMVERPKFGFGIPLDPWLRGPLRGWAESLLDERRLHGEGFFNPVPIRRAWQEHLAGKRRWEFHLWDVLMFQAWLEHSRLRSSVNDDVETEPLREST
ncbi:MAG: asparagine synthase (glutamine-hydrolyzing) [Acidobacteriaceae bacterium]|nr:asparagine synthase (glutamine-hydrolyzing) [Acidobacteriaceae bacterium]MBV9499267.1 asparagine synthase (glutamine-hydrolyzing) [Acidobacteriaceae bacterium]